MRPPALVFGVAIADVTLDETVELIGELVEEGRATGRRHQVATVNLDFLVNAITDAAVREILQRAELCLADGMPVVWAARLLGMPIRERVAGADLVPRLVEASATTGHRVHVFGSAPEVAAAARELLAERYPGAQVSIDPGPMIDDPTDVADEVLDRIAAAEADILCIALGNPKQERFISAHRHRLDAPVMIGVGGSLDLLVGRRRRAPTWAQRIGLEWVVRAAQEPRRLGRRYARDVRVFVPAFTRHLRASRARRAGLGLHVDVATAPTGVAARVGGAVVVSDAMWRAAADLLCDGAEFSVTTSAGALRDDAMARLVGLVAAARRGGGPIRWSSPQLLRVAAAAADVHPYLLGLGDAWESEHDA